MKIRFAFVGLTMLLILVFAMFCTGQAETNTRIVTDMRGVDVEIPATVDAYVESWASHNTIDFLLDGYEHMVMTGVALSEKNWVWRMNENIKTVAVAEFSAEMNLEEIIALQPDVVFGKVESYRALFENVGIAFVNVDFSSFETMKASVRLTAEVLGGNAPEMAEKYIAYLDESIAWTQARTAAIPADKRISIVHGHPAHELLIDGGDSVIDEWIVYSGCINAAAEDIKGLVQAASIEMMYEWDPDVIISGDYADDREAVLADSAWANLKAVKNGNVITNPKGLLMWDRSGVELPLQVKWSAATMYPELFEDFSICEETKYFFREFFNYELQDEDVEKILNHLDP